MIGRLFSASSAAIKNYQRLCGLKRMINCVTFVFACPYWNVYWALEINFISVFRADGIFPAAICFHHFEEAYRLEPGRPRKLSQRLIENYSHHNNKQENIPGRTGRGRGGGCGAWWNFYRIHYDSAIERGDGTTDCVIQFAEMK